MRLSILVLSLLLAYLSWRFIETPFRTRRFENRQIFGAAAVAMAALYVAGVAFWATNGFPSRVSEKVLLAEAGTKSEGVFCHAIATQPVRGGTVCETGAEHKSSYDFVLWGDSHAFHFVPAIDTLAKSHKLSGIVFYQPACFPFINGTGLSKGCRNFNAAVARWIEQHPVKLVILGGRWTNHKKQIKQYLADEDPVLNPGGLGPTLALLISLNITVSVLDQVPEFPTNVSHCRARALMYERNPEECFTEPAARFYSQHKILDSYFGFLKRRYSFTVASAASAICRGDWCHAGNGTTIFMTDSNHLSQAGALHLMPSLRIPLLSGQSGDFADGGATSTAHSL